MYVHNIGMYVSEQDYFFSCPRHLNLKLRRLNFKPTIETNFNGQIWTFLIIYTTICYFYTLVKEN
jgi:hypothetical protein